MAAASVTFILSIVLGGSVPRLMPLHEFHNNGRAGWSSPDADGESLWHHLPRGRPIDRGTIFKVSSDGTLTTLVNFAGTDGAFPKAGLIAGGDGNFYGTTSRGGTDDAFSLGAGTIFKVTPQGSLTMVSNFNSLGEGRPENPVAPLFLASDGKFYGTSELGGSEGSGTVFRFDAATGEVTVLVNFDGTNGAHPRAGLIEVGSDLYGTTQGNFEADGTVFRLTKAGAMTVLRRFVPVNAVETGPTAELVLAGDGKLYGTTFYGGTGNSGSVFRLNPDGTGFAVLHSFIGTESDGVNPQAGLALGGDGALYGATSDGQGLSPGTLFRMTTAGEYSLVGRPPRNTPGGGVAFAAGPQASLVLAPNGGLYGCTARSGLNDLGQIFALSLPNAITSVASFSYPGGSQLDSALTPDASGNLYGVARHGGRFGGGTAFRVAPDGMVTTLAEFGPGQGIGLFPIWHPTGAADGNFYGTTSADDEGNFAGGGAFRLTPDGQRQLRRRAGDAARGCGAAHPRPRRATLRHRHARRHGCVLPDRHEWRGGAAHLSAFRAQLLQPGPGAARRLLRRHPFRRRKQPRHHLPDHTGRPAHHAGGF